MSCSLMGPFLINIFKTNLSSRFSIQNLVILIFEIGKLIVLELFIEMRKYLKISKWLYLTNPFYLLIFRRFECHYTHYQGTVF